MEHPLKNIPLVLTPNKIFKEINTDSGMIKKRKLSMSSDSSDSNSSIEKNLLNEQFSDLTIDIRSRTNFGNQNEIKIEEPVQSHPIAMPKPVRIGKPTDNSNPFLATPPKETFFNNIIKMSQSDIPGISKYLNLDLHDKLNTWDKITKSSMTRDLTSTMMDSKFKTGAMITSLMKSPFSIPFLNPELLVPMKNSFASSGILQNHSDGDLFSKKYNLKTKYIGTLTQEQRTEKVNAYLEKKKNRKWKHIRYTIRKDLADQRERVQGRFVKTNKSLSHSDIILKTKSLSEDNKMISENRSAINFDLTGSTSLGKRMDKTDLQTDNSIPGNLVMNSIETNES